MECNWIYFPLNGRPPQPLMDVVKAVNKNIEQIRSDKNSEHSDSVLRILAFDLEQFGFNVEVGKKKNEKLSMPVLYGEKGLIDKAFEVDAVHRDTNTIVEIEAGRAVANNQFLKDFFEACMIQDAAYLCVVVRNVYKSGDNSSRDYEKVVTFFQNIVCKRAHACSVKRHYGYWVLTAVVLSVWNSSACNYLCVGHMVTWAAARTQRMRTACMRQGFQIVLEENLCCSVSIRHPSQRTYD